MNLWEKITEKTAVTSVLHLNPVRLDIEKTLVRVGTQGYGLLFIHDEAMLGRPLAVIFLTPDKKAHHVYLTKGSKATLVLYSLWGLQKIVVQVEERNLDLSFMYPRMLDATPVSLGMRVKPENEYAHSHLLHAEKMQAQVSVHNLRRQLLQSLRIHCAAIRARQLASFRLRIPAQRAQISVPSASKAIVIPSFQEHLKRQNFDFKFMSLMNKKEVS